MKSLRAKYGTFFESFQIGTCLHLWDADIWHRDACCMWDALAWNREFAEVRRAGHQKPSCCKIPPFNSFALKLVVWFVKSGEGRYLIFNLFCTNVLHLFTIMGVLLLIRPAIIRNFWVWVEEMLCVWCWLTEVDSQASARFLQRGGSRAVFEYSYRFSFQHSPSFPIWWGKSPSAVRWICFSLVILG